MKIYFAGSIRAGRSNAKIYSELIEYLKTYGEVWTEHVGDKELTETGDDGPNDRWIYERDLEWLRSSDYIVAEVTLPSFGVGYEVAVAEQLGLKTLCIYQTQAEKRLSAMLAGNKNLIVREYTTLQEAFAIIDDFLKESLSP